MPKLHRSTTDRMIAGVCGGASATYDFDPSLVRIGVVLIGVLTGFIPVIVVYIILAVILPEGPPEGD